LRARRGSPERGHGAEAEESFVKDHLTMAFPTPVAAYP
jgi:hypothetical protein